MSFRSLALLGYVGGCCLGSLAGAAETNGPPETWLTNVASYPTAFAKTSIQTNRFQSLHAEFLAETVQVLWTPPRGDAAEVVLLHVSADEVGHWPARDWHTLPMQLRGPAWLSLVPVDSLDVPLVYFVEARDAQGVHLSPMRLCWLHRLGLETPTRVFWPFLEGFEEGLESWTWVSGGPADGQFQTSDIAKNGKKALLARVPADKPGVTIGTTRLRGWQMLEHGASGVSIWMRTRTGSGRARFSLLANAFTTNQVVAIRPGEVPIGDTWEQVELPFSSFSKFPLAELDFFTIELLGKPGTEFLLDNLQMLGRWILN